MGVKNKMYWKIKALEQHLKIEKESGLNKNVTITKDYIKHLETRLKLMKEAYEEGKKEVKK